MASFEYQALNQSGKTIKGVTSGDHVKQVSTELRSQGLMPTSIKKISDNAEEGETQGRSHARYRKTKLKNTDLSLLTRQMATLLGSGLTIEATLSAIFKQAEEQKIKSLVSDLRSLILEGYSLSEAISMYPKSFPDIYRSSISAGEQSGTLDEVLDRLSDYLENRDSVQQRLSVALVYPIFLTVASISIVVALVAFVVPKVVSVFEDTGQELPLLTTLLIKLSSFLQNYGLWLLLVVVTIGAASHYFFKKPHPRYWLHSLYLKTFGLKRLVRSIDSARMARTLSIMVGSGVPILTSMRASHGVVNNVVLQSDLVKATNEVAEGVPISRALDRGGHFPPLLIQMVASGENNGQLSNMLEKAASVTENEMQTRISMIVSLFEPAMILIMGLVVLVIVLAILMPIFDLNQVLS